MKYEVKKTFSEIILTIKDILFKNTVLLVPNSNIKVNCLSPCHAHTHKMGGALAATLPHLFILFC